jgi:hypothetical protein
VLDRLGSLGFLVCHVRPSRLVRVPGLGFGQPFTSWTCTIFQTRSRREAILKRYEVTFDCLDGATGQVRRGWIAPATRETFRSWLEQLPRPAVLTVEGCTG